MKFVKFILIFVAILSVGSSCNQPDLTVQAACTDFTETDIILDFDYLGSCRKVFENGSTKAMKVEITVDGIAIDASGGSLKFLKGLNKDSDNDNDNLGNVDRRTYKVQVPRCGSYLISVVVRGTDGTCFMCCQNSTTIPNPGNCSQTPFNSKGTPRFRGVSAKINVDLANPPRPSYIIKPLAESCSNCGC